MHPDTLGGYERGDSQPDFAFLEMYKRRFSVNLDWLITGEGEMFLPGARDDGEARLNAELDAIEEKLWTAEVPIDPAGMTSDQAEMHDALQRIAATASEDATRARADLFLKLAWTDADAEERSERRFKTTVARFKRVGEMIKRAETALNWEMPVAAREAMKALALGYEISEEDLRDAIGMIHSAWHQKEAGR